MYRKQAEKYMKVKVFCAGTEDEFLYRKYQNAHLAIDYEPASLTEDNVDLVCGYDAIVVLTRCVIGKDMAELLKERGISYILTRSAGYDHLDIQALEETGIKAANVPKYSPDAIAEYVCMTALMSVRKMRLQQKMIGEQDYTLKGIRGKELNDLNIGIIGTGRIGFQTVKLFAAFTDHILMYDLYPHKEAAAYGRYTGLDELYAKSDVIVFHCPLTEENYHMVDDKTMSNMKDGVILINPARGGLWDYAAVLRGLQTGKIEAAVFDVYEDEKSYLRRKQPGTEDETLKELLKFPNVIYTAHSAFYTDTAIRNMVEGVVKNLTQYEESGSCDCELTQTKKG